MFELGQQKYFLPCRLDGWPFKEFNDEYHLCAGGEKGKTTCSGDSGGK